MRNLPLEPLDMASKRNREIRKVRRRVIWLETGIWKSTEVPRVQRTTIAMDESVYAEKDSRVANSEFIWVSGRVKVNFKVVRVSGKDTKHKPLNTN